MNVAVNSIMKLRDVLTSYASENLPAGDYLWQWKGGAFAGASTSSHLDLFPIPGDELSSNPNYNGVNNPGY